MAVNTPVEQPAPPGGHPVIPPPEAVKARLLAARREVRLLVRLLAVSEDAADQLPAGHSPATGKVVAHA